MGTNPKITIITPVYNAEKDIETCILSVAGQLYPYKEHLFVDGLSTDGTLEILRRYAEKYSHITVVSEKDTGIYDAMNKGIDRARGEWIYFFGSDDVFYDESVLDKIFNLEDIDSYDVVYGNVLWGDTGKVYDGKFSLLKLMDKNICHQAMFFRRELFSKIGRFDPGYKSWADYLFNIKCFTAEAVRLRYFDTIVAVYGTSGQSSQMADADFIRDRESIYSKNFPVEYLQVKEKLRSQELEIEQKNQQIAGREEQIGHLDRLIANREEQIASRERQIAEQNHLLAERENAIVALRQSLELLKTDRDNTINAVFASLSWRITSPLRLGHALAIRLKTSLISAGAIIFAKITGPVIRKLVETKYFISSLLAKVKEYYRLNGRLPGIKESFEGIRRIHFEAKAAAAGLPVTDTYQAWIDVNRWNCKKEERLRRRLKELSAAPLLSVIMPVYNPPVEYLNRAIASVCSQVYGNWELCIADDASTNGEVRSALIKWAATDARIKICYRTTNGNISIATNSAAALAAGSHIVFLDQDDELTPDALGEIALYIAARPETDILYSDDDKIDTEGQRFAPQFKPDWSPELLLSYMYFSHVFVVNRELFEAVKGARTGFEGSQDYDLALRASEKARHVGHIPLVLYHWRVLPGSTASSAMAKPDSMEAGRKAVQDALSRRGLQATAYQPDWAKAAGVGIFSHRFVQTDPPAVTIIIPTKDQAEVLTRCVDSVLEKTDYANYEILIIDNDSVEPATVAYLNKLSASPRVSVARISNPEGGFSFAYINNRAAELARSEYVLFLNNDTEVLNREWLAQMVGYGQISGVGAVGAKLFYPDRTIQHAGVLIKFYHGMAGHAFKGLSEGDPGYLAYAKVLRNYSAVTAACLLTPRRLFIDMGGFDEKEFNVAYNDVDYCGRLLDTGRRVVYTPEAELLHHEGYSRGFSDNPRENVNFRSKYYGKKDCYYNPSLSLDSEHFEIWPRSVYSGENPGPIKALMCAHNLNHEGAPYSQFELTFGLKEKGVLEPVVFSPQDGPLRALYEACGIRVVVDPDLGYIFEISGYRERVKSFAVFMDELGVELVYANTLINFHVIAAARDAGLPSIWNIRESESWQYYHDMWGEELAGEAAACFTYPYKVIFVAHTTKHIYRAFEGRHNFHVVYNGLNLERIFLEAEKYDRKSMRAELGVKDDELAVLLPGTVCERKGQHDLVRALGVLAPDCLKRVRCFIVGDWNSPMPYNSELHKLAASLPAEVKARLSILPITAEIFKYYKAADIFVCSSRIESFPRIILEAMAFNLPIITTPVFGIQEQVQEGVNALFYNPGDIDSLAKALEQLVADDFMRTRFAENAVFVLRQLENFDEMTAAYATLFREAYLSAGSMALMPEAITVFKGMSVAAPAPIRKVTFVTSYKDENSQRFRVYNLIEGLTESGVDCAVIKEDFGGSLDVLLDSDLVVAFRVGASTNLRRIFDAFRCGGVPLVFDVDDLVFEPEAADLLHGLSTLGREERQKAVSGLELLREALLMCDYATCTTKALAVRIAQLGKNCFVIPNTISRQQFELARELKSVKRGTGDAKVRVGYFSGTRTHDRDFGEVSDALYEVMTKNPQVEFHLVGILDLDSKFSKFGDRVVRAPLMDYLEMLRYLAGMDINLAPLEMNNVFTAGKSELKIFEAGLLGVPTLASATDSYAGCITDGVNGFLAATKEEWVEKLQLLVIDEVLRKVVAGQAEIDFVQRYYLPNVIKSIVDCYTEITSDRNKF